MVWCICCRVRGEAVGEGGQVIGNGRSARVAAGLVKVVRSEMTDMTFLKHPANICKMLSVLLHSGVRYFSGYSSTVCHLKAAEQSS